MDTITEKLLESWDRQVNILTNIANLVDDTNRNVKPSEDGWTMTFHLAHVHEVRYWWLKSISPENVKDLGDVFVQEGEEWHAISDLEEIKRQLQISAKVVRDVVENGLASGATAFGPYDHPVFFLQHMIWHEGYHVGLLMLALRNAGQEPTDEWDEKNVWSYWRTE